MEIACSWIKIKSSKFFSFPFLLFFFFQYAISYQPGRGIITVTSTSSLADDPEYQFSSLDPILCAFDAYEEALAYRLPNRVRPLGESVSSSSWSFDLAWMKRNFINTTLVTRTKYLRMRLCTTTDNCFYTLIYFNIETFVLFSFQICQIFSSPIFQLFLFTIATSLGLTDIA